MCLGRLVLGEPESRPTLPAPEPLPRCYSCDKHQWRGTSECPGCKAPIASAKEIGEAMQSYLASNVAMLLFSKLTLYRAIGENPRVVVSYKGSKFRVHLERSNGEKEYFNRDGEP